ncbi:protein kinase [Streptomyces sp. NBC_00820]|uniref:serine/threonine-protein kinase n=1 Tax=Streptomyces sp. NBC_00820 TaxID=2975842 RepID=UPI002ED5A7DA|nr:protein kinase [Streptomyces sp. NBC_00820]
MGEVFAGRYELADPIGRGGVGAVWRAWDHRRRRYVAAKVLQQRDAHALLRFVREQALRIDHPHVLAPASWAADDDQVLFTMDLVAGGSLVHLVNDYGPLPPAFVCTLIDQLLSGLSAVHAEGVVHRDIKPANILLEATGTGRPRLRLSDFGIAMRFGEPRLTETNLVVGTPGYLAPEQMLGADPDYPADLFAVGLVALYLLEGAKPDAKAIVRYFMEHGTPGPPKGVPDPLWQVVATLLQPDPGARFRTATGARKALASATELLQEPGLDDEPIEIFDQLGPLPKGFGTDGPLVPSPNVRRRRSEADAGGTSGEGGEGGEATESTTSPAPERPDRAAAAPPDPRSDDSWTDRSTPAPTPLPSTPSAHTAPSAHAKPVTASTPSMSDTGSFHLPPPQPTPSPRPDRPAQHAASHTEPTPTAPPTPAPPPPRAQPQPSPEPYRQPLPPHHGTSGTDHTPSPSPHAPWVPAPLPSAQPLSSYSPSGPSTAEYTARDPQAQPPADPTPTPTPVTTPITPLIATPVLSPVPSPVPPQAPSATPSAARSATPHRRARRHPGPPARVAIPVLLLALACYAVGFWALARV